SRLTTSLSTSTRCPDSAFATAERSVLATSFAPRLGVYSRMPSAVSTGLPRMSPTTSRAFCAESRTNRLVARASMLTPSSRWPRAPRRRELAELVAHRVLGDEHRDELAPVVDREGEADHFRRDGRAPRPRLHHALLAALDHRPHLLEQVRVHERPLLDRPRHRRLSLPRLPPLDDPAVGALVVPRLVALGGLAPRRLRVVALRAALATAVRVIGRIHGDPAH